MLQKWLGLALYSVRGRVITGVVVLYAVLVGFVVWDMVNRQQGFMQSQLARQGDSLARTLAVNAPSWLISNDLNGLQELVDSLASVHNLRLAMILDQDGRVRASTDAGLFNLVLSDGPSRTLLAATAPSQLWHDGAVDSLAAVTAAGRSIGYARVILDAGPVQAEIDDIARHGIAYILLAMILGGLVSWLAVRTMTARLDRLSRAADAIAAGDLDIRLAGFDGRDEVSRLGQDFDQMARSLAEEREKQERAEAALFAEKELAQVTLMSIGDAVVVTDVAGRVDFLNPVAEELTGWHSAEAKGRPLETVFRIINASSRATAVNPVDVVLREGRIVGLANHTVLIRRDGVELNIDDSAAPIRDREGRIIGVVLVFHDVTHAHEMARKMSWAATHDALTGLINRGDFERRLQELVDHMEAGKHHALLYVDLDQFKVVNDTCGHAAGDQLLRQLSFLMQEQVRESDTLARLGGDEFGVLLANCPAPKAQHLAEQLLEAVRGFRFAWENKSFVIGASIGLVEIAGEDLSVANIMADADTACYAAKDQGRNRVQAYSAADSGVMRRYGEMHWVGRVNRAIEEDRFRLYFQPIVPLRNGAGKVGHGEVLLRMLDEEGGIIPPNSFLPSAERYGLIQRIDRWVVVQTMAWMTTHELSCSINLSGQSVGDDRFLDFIVEQVRTSAVAPERICFEITETAAIANLARAVQFMGQLREQGCRFALDDFGSGLSSFGYLRNLPVDYLKIDGAFVRQVDCSAIDHAMVAAINNIGQVMGIRTVAEFVENDAIRQKLTAMGVDFGQGFGIAMPAPIEDYSPR